MLSVVGCVLMNAICMCAVYRDYMCCTCCLPRQLASRFATTTVQDVTVFRCGMNMGKLDRTKRADPMPVCVMKPVADTGTSRDIPHVF